MPGVISGRVLIWIGSLIIFACYYGEQRCWHCRELGHFRAECPYLHPYQEGHEYEEPGEGDGTYNEEEDAGVEGESCQDDYDDYDEDAEGEFEGDEVEEHDDQQEDSENVGEDADDLDEFPLEEAPVRLNTIIYFTDSEEDDNENTTDDA